MPAAFKSKVRLIPWILLGVALCVKIVFLLCLCDVFFYGEELEKGTAGKAMLDGLPVAHHTLAYHYYEGGGFVSSHLKALAFLIVGETYLAHKLVSLGGIALVLLAGMTLARRHFGRKAAFWFGLLFTFAPEVFQKLPLLSLGIHFEASLFLILMFDWTLRVLYRSETSWRIFFVLGLIGGVGTYFSYQLVPAVGFCGLWILVKRPKLVFSPVGLVGLLGYAIGLLPLFWMYQLVGDAIFDIHGTSLFGGGAWDGLNSLKAREFLLSIFQGKDVVDLIGPIVYPVVTLIAMAVLCLDRDQERARYHGPGIFLSTFVVFWIAVYLNSGFVHGFAHYDYYFNRFTPLWLIATLLCAGWVARVQEADDHFSSRFGFVCGVALTVLGGFFSWRVIDDGRMAHVPENWEVLSNTKGVTYASYFAKFKRHLDGTLEQKLTVLTSFDEDPALLYPEISEELLTREELRKEGDPSLEELLARLEAFDPERTVDFLRGLGPWVHQRAGGDVGAALRAVEGAPEKYRPALREAVGRFGSGFLMPLQAEEQITNEVRAGLGAAGEAEYLLGVGERIFTLFRIRPDQAQEFIDRQPEEARGALHRGYDAAVDRRWIRTR